MLIRKSPFLLLFACLLLVAAESESDSWFKKATGLFKKSAPLKKSIDSAKKQADPGIFKKQNEFFKKQMDMDMLKKQFPGMKKQGDLLGLKKQTVKKQVAELKKQGPILKKQLAPDLKKQVLKKQVLKKDALGLMKKQVEGVKKQTPVKKQVLKKQAVKKQAEILKKQAYKKQAVKKSAELKKQVFKKQVSKKQGMKKQATKKQRKKFMGKKRTLQMKKVNPLNNKKQMGLRNIRKQLLGDSWDSTNRDIFEEVEPTSSNQLESDTRNLFTDNSFEQDLTEADWEAVAAAIDPTTGDDFDDDEDIYYSEADYEQFAAEFPDVDLEVNGDNMYYDAIDSDEEEVEGGREVLRKVIGNRDEIKERIRQINAQNNAKREEMRGQFWYDIEAVSNVLTSRGHRAALYIFYAKGYAGDDIYPVDLFSIDPIKSNDRDLDQRATIGKVLQLNVLSTYLLEQAVPRRTSTEFLEQSTRLDGYACHCSPHGQLSDNLVKGSRGVPLDSLDQACHTRNSCYRCIGLELGQACDYRKAYNMVIDSTTFEIFCEDPLATCQRRLCECDKAFFQKRIDYETTYNAALAQVNGFSLDFGSCEPLERTHTGRWDKCCGDHSRRKPYSEDLGFACCGDQNVYKPANAQCCEDGRVVTGLSTC